MEHGPVFLIGGGWTAEGYPHTYGPFVAAAGRRGPARIACVLLDGPERDAQLGRSVFSFGAVGVTDLSPIFVSAERPLRLDDLQGATGVFVGGGLTPAYHDAIVPEAGSWLPWLREQGIPYAGFSAGAMIAPTQGIIGGWRLRRDAGDLVICSEDVCEDEEYLDIRPGLGLVPFAVDVHASQYGTPTRLLHAVRTGAVTEGWAIDEDTMLACENGTLTVHGLGSAYRVRPAGDHLAVDIVGAGEQREEGSSR